jgi:hypothetical protein
MSLAPGSHCRSLGITAAYESKPDIALTHWWFFG